LFYATNAIKNYRISSYYWLSNETIASFNITLKQPTSLTQLSLSDHVYDADERRGTAEGYIVTLYDCSDNILFTKELTEKLTPYERASVNVVGYLDLF